MKNCKDCIHDRICQLWRKQEFQDASLFVDDCFEEKETRESGEWVSVNNPSYSPSDPNTEPNVYICSCCWNMVSHRTDYCPNCGARMSEGD